MGDKGRRKSRVYGVHDAYAFSDVLYGDSLYVLKKFTTKSFCSFFGVLVIFFLIVSYIGYHIQEDYDRILNRFRKRS